MSPRAMARALLVLAAAALPAGADDEVRPQPLLPETFDWQAPFALPGVRAAWIVGSQTGSGPYLLRVELAAGTRLPRHRHPDTRITTVLDGTLHVGFGEAVDDARLVAIPAGAAYVAPAGQPHWIVARDGPVRYQESGTAPSGTEPLDRP